ncbi:sensor domain-containing diguanylate cyclase [Dorea sp. D27]|uniref:sensor domain-containing diguanylate cyclase n=1 Tax=Dorea sp. D27 TaxID=658665 RepID=UPI0006736DB4|nr:diguanylate cyclase [Dorea sp. D27]KMZ52743.1 diguanylate cyclaSe/phosphodiesterase with PAS/PAC sensor(s) [Dorea sp. D27]
MQKIFKKYTIIIMSTAILSILVFNFFFSASSSRSRQLDTFNAKIDQVIHTMENNQEELASIKENLDEDYLTRAKAAAYVVEKNPGVLDSVEELTNLAALLDVDELHVTEADGVIRYSSVPKYIGLDFHNGRQMRGFLPILESDSDDMHIIQEAQPNTAEAKMMKYVGVSRKGVKGLVQVGLEPIRQMEAQERNTYDYIFNRFPTDVGEEFFAMDADSGKVVAHTGKGGDSDELEACGLDSLEECKSGAYRTVDAGVECYVVTRVYGDVLIGAYIEKATLYHTFWKNILLTFIYLLVVEVIAVLLLNYLVKQKVVSGIHKIRDHLSDITKGGLDTTVEVGGTPEFEDLSNGINRMVRSVVSSSNRISKIIAMSQIPLAAFEYQNDMDYVFVTAKLGELLDMDADMLERYTKDPEAFLHMIRVFMESTVENEKDVFYAGAQRYVRIHFTIEEAGYYGAVTDATREMLDKRKMLYENNHDQLTGLSRYPYFKQKASHILGSMNEDEICACVMMDLDAFKNINDTYGHDVGDRYLQEFAQFMKELPKEHCLVARRSGDEFCIFAFGYRKEDEIKSLLDRFWKALRSKTVSLTDGEECIISASGGYVCTNDRKLSLTWLLRQADAALYEVKRKNKGHFEL